MIKHKFFLSISFCFVLLNFSFVYSQTVSKEVNSEEYILNLTWDDSHYFTGGIEVLNKSGGNVVFKTDSVFTRYNWDTLIDLDNDGKKELILDLGSGATMYDYNMFLIFDFTKNVGPLFEIHNAELVTNVDAVPKIVSSVRMSPSYLGAGFSYSLKYYDGNLVLEDNPDESKVLKSLEPDEEDEVELIKNFKKEVNECEESSSFLTYFEAYITQQKILNKEDKGWKFFDKYYNCKDKKKARALLKKSINSLYNEWRTWNFKFNPNRFE